MISATARRGCFVALVVGLTVWSLGCSPPGTPRDAAEKVVVDPVSAREFAVIEQQSQLHRDAEVLARGRGLLDRRPAHPLGDAVTALMIQSATRLPDLDQARDLALDFPVRWPASARRDHAMRLAASKLAEAGRLGDGLIVLEALAKVQPEGATRRFTINQGGDWFGRTPSDTLRIWMASTGPLATTAGRVLVERQIASGDFTDAESTAEALVRLHPGDPDAQHVMASAAEALAMAPSSVLGRVGVLCPLTGRYARFGNAFQAGVQLAAGHVVPSPDRTWETVLEDTEGDPVLAALRAQTLCDEFRCQVLIGGLLSSTTATMALVAESRGVPIISPTATSERLSLLGGHVLQPNLSGPLEAELLARLAVDVLLKTRHAIIRPKTPEGASLARSYADAVVRWGGEILIEEIIDSAATDFRAQVHAIRRVRPEVVFAPTTVDQMVLLGPQLDFYRIGALLLGPSEWNSARLLDQAGSVMERALCVAAEVAYPKDWSIDFGAVWPADQYDEEASRIGRSAYLATRLALSTMVANPHLESLDLTAGMRSALTGEEEAGEGPERYASSVRMVEDSRFVPFPGSLYTEAWRREVALEMSLAGADSLTTPGFMPGVIPTVADSLGGVIDSRH